MPELTDENFRRIEDTLEALSKRNNVSQRRQCWRTAAEMIDLVRDEDPSWTISALDASLCTRFLANEDCRIRPAYYPTKIPASVSGATWKTSTPALAAMPSGPSWR